MLLGANHHLPHPPVHRLPFCVPVLASSSSSPPPPSPTTPSSAHSLQWEPHNLSLFTEWFFRPSKSMLTQEKLREEGHPDLQIRSQAWRASWAAEDKLMTTRQRQWWHAMSYHLTRVARAHSHDPAGCSSQPREAVRAGTEAFGRRGAWSESISRAPKVTD